MKIQTERLNIHLADDDEMQELIAKESNADLRRAYTEMLTLSQEKPDYREWYAVWLIDLSSGERIGDACFKGLSTEGVTEIGYGIRREYWGKGYMTEAVKAMTQWAFDRPGVRQIEAETEADNLASQKVLIHAGFKPTGTNGEEGPRFILVPER